jgi:hypothetical protein
MSEKDRIDKMTVTQLRELAKDLGVVGATGMKKEELVHEICSRRPDLAPPREESHHRVVLGREGRDANILKKGRAELKRRISAAVTAKDLATARDLRRQKKHARRLIKKARRAGIIVVEQSKKKEGPEEPAQAG